MDSRLRSEPYRPCNGDEGEWFMGKWCDNCHHDAAFQGDDSKPGCEIILGVMTNSPTDPNYPTEWVYDPNGHPICTKYRAIDTEPMPKPICRHTLPLFGEEA